MKKWWLRITIAVLGAAILGSLIWQSTGPSEPVYQGKTLSSWLDHHVPTSSANPPYNSPGWHQAEEALRQIGTNAIPTLLRMIRAHDFPWKLKLVRLAEKQRLVRFRYRYAMPLNEEAEYAFRILGTNAASAVPELIEIYEGNLSESSQRCAALALGSIGGPAKAAVPALLKNFTHTNDHVRFYAVSAVANIGGEPDLILPVLKSVLKDSYKSVRWNAVVGMERYGCRARSVVPDLQEALKDEPIRPAVETALWRIAPEKVGKPLVVEESTPIIAQGVTTEALKVTFYGKRQTLIPAGKSVPVLAQYWNSDPRPRLTFYRSASPPEGKDHFLGEFEVMDVPSSANVNISTLCVIADGRIILCARDNTRNLFLEIRRVDKPVAE
jgi:hypothetical protein